MKDGIIRFFYVDDIVFTYKKDKANDVEQIVKSLEQKLTITVMEELE